MKSKFLPYLLLTFLSCIGLSSCNDFLDVKPKSQIKESDLFESEKGFVDALAGVYTSLSGRGLYGDKLTMSFLDVLAQRYKIGTTSSPYYAAAQYDYENESAKIPVKSAIRDLWKEGYEVIANINNLLYWIDQKESLITKENYDLIKGEALALRAFVHFDLLRLFGPMYSKSPNGQAIPYRTTLTKEAQSPIAANEVIDSIIEDLTLALEHLKNDPVLMGDGESIYPEFTKDYRNYRMNHVAVEGLLARVFLYSGDKDQAFSYANKVIESDTYRFVSSSEASLDGACRDRTYRHEHLFGVMVSNMKVYTDLYFNTVPSTYEDEVLSNDEVVINELFENSSTDIRRAYLWERKEGKLVHSKFWQLESQIAACSFAKNIVPLIRVSEIFYIAAESAPSVTEGVTFLNEVRANRGLDPVSSQIDEDQLNQEIAKEYQKEFFSEGQLFYYYKRKEWNSIPGSSVSADESVYVLPTPTEESIFNQ